MLVTFTFDTSVDREKGVVEFVRASYRTGTLHPAPVRVDTSNAIFPKKKKRKKGRNSPLLYSFHPYSDFAGRCTCGHPKDHPNHRGTSVPDPT